MRFLKRTLTLRLLKWISSEGLNRNSQKYKCIRGEINHLLKVLVVYTGGILQPKCFGNVCKKGGDAQEDNEKWIFPFEHVWCLSIQSNKWTKSIRQTYIFDPPERSALGSSSRKRNSPTLHFNLWSRNDVSLMRCFKVFFFGEFILRLIYLQIQSNLFSFAPFVSFKRMVSGI